ncbi:LysR family transcriptional regulator [Burkholderia pseudomallei]|uniref:immunity 52 family protein n=1 Tax=Burkholderia pseudomallei TaxID=28450 RepID=UPI000F05C474|nr:immunity 52 family protein [Burkholderia pseudomallei]CAJ2759051.1 LysR family transcriptional regulator [Burkholderia pseudomallei]VCJ92990.1 LysR family transcriptional regulator [Burkholderia pseudomallei]VCJ95335.1 LysR family transcriptional regulator [Burkholderia pseudomallei]VCJ95365.1 LysR family transcriptional regulator [Burkholderia pseudomallei]VCJ98164.1 LysR family transcriptional regulator [Burkholderia pseudomallei]
MDINAMFRDASLAAHDFQGMLARESRLVAALSTKEPLMAHANWRLTGDSLEEASLYPAFDENGEPSASALAVLTMRAGGKKRGVSHAAIWNAASDNDSAAISCHASDAKVLPDRVTLEIDAPRCYQSADDVVGIIEVVVATFQPLLVEVSPKGYFEKQVFDDKPGVGWMLYLPTIITVQQLPEARALIPVRDASGKQTGTIIVSVTDEVFSAENPEHVEIANRIEIRLVDQDLLPRYADL